MRAGHSVASTLSISVRILFLQIVQEQLQGFLWSLRNRRDKRMGHIRGCRRCPPIALAAKALKSVAALLDQLFKMQRRRPSAWAAPSFWALRVPRRRLRPGFRRPGLCRSATDLEIEAELHEFDGVSGRQRYSHKIC